MIAKVNVVLVPVLSGRELQSPALRYGDGSQSASGEELRPLRRADADAVRAG